MHQSVRVGACAIMCISGSTYAHHAVGPNFDQSQIVETEGVITEVLWQNPHVLMTVVSTGPDGEDQNWEIEGNSVSNVRRLGLTPDLLPTGTRVRIAGNPGRANEHSMWLMNILLPNNEEILFNGAARPRWSDRTLGKDIRSEVAANTELGFFRVWTSATSPPAFWGRNHPMTEAARAVQAAFDPVNDAPTLNCVPKGMPFIMEQPYPMELIDEGDVIVMRMEEFDSVRRFNMTADGQAQASNPEFLGFSTGRWDGDVLIVETTDINYPWFNGRGIPQSADVQITEHFELSDDGSQLEYAMIYSDPQTFTETLTLRKSWVWRPGEEVHPYDCIE